MLTRSSSPVDKEGLRISALIYCLLARSNLAVHWPWTISFFPSEHNIRPPPPHTTRAYVWRPLVMHVSIPLRRWYSKISCQAICVRSWIKSHNPRYIRSCFHLTFHPPGEWYSPVYEWRIRSRFKVKKSIFDQISPPLANLIEDVFSSAHCCINPLLKSHTFHTWQMRL